jgi:colanic acid/amylovoran biosynthesis glycosyltransferase
VMTRIAYLTSRYPAVSHAFIRREVEALRNLGWDIETMSIRRARPDDILSAADVVAVETTFALLPLSLRALVKAHLGCFSKTPRRYLSTLRTALELGNGARGRLWQVFYFAEAVCFYEHCRRNRIAHVHAHHADPAGDVAMLIARLSPNGVGSLRWSFTGHGSDINHGDRRLLCAKVASAAATICVSDQGANVIRELVGPELAHKISVVRTGVDPDQFRPLADLRPVARRILTVGRLDPLKGHATLIEALLLLRQRGQDFDLSIVGSGPERADLERRVHDSGLDDAVAFRGSIAHDSLPEVYADADVFCLPSYSEGVPVVLMEAMAAGLPVISTRITGIPELVDAQSGFLVEPGSPQQLAEALAAALGSSHEDRTAMGTHGRRVVLEGFNRSATAVALAHVFSTIVGCAEGESLGQVTTGDLLPTGSSRGERG